MAALLNNDGAVLPDLGPAGRGRGGADFCCSEDVDVGWGRLRLACWE